MSWFSGSGFGKLLAGIVKSRDFQESATQFVVQSGQKLLDSLLHGKPDDAKAIAQNMVSNPDVIVGAIVKGTEAENLVDSEVVQKADAELAKPH